MHVCVCVGVCLYFACVDVRATACVTLYIGVCKCTGICCHFTCMQSMLQKFTF